MAESKKSNLSTLHASAQNPYSITGFIGKKLRNAYYKARESFGDHKRDLVVYNVEQACDQLEDTRDQFESALEHYKSIIAVDETTLEHKYYLFKRQYEFCLSKSNAVSERIDSIERVSSALFIEWEAELEQYTNRSLRTRSKQQLKVSRQHYGRLIRSMRRAEAKIQPVLLTFRDQTLFLKHNLNAQAISALQHEFVVMTMDISMLIEAMEKTISEANMFVSGLVEHKRLPTS